MKKISTLIIAGLTAMAATAAPVKVCNSIKKPEKAPRVERTVALAHAEEVKAKKAAKAVKPTKKSLMAEQGRVVLTDEQIKATATKRAPRKSANAQVLMTETFACLTEGSIDDPVMIELDEEDNIPEEIIGEENYGFGGVEIAQAGGQIYVYCETEDDYGMLWTPDYEAGPGKYTISFDACIATEEDDWDILYIACSNYTSDGPGSLYDRLYPEWQHYEFTFEAYDLPYGAVYFGMYPYYEYNLVLKNLKVEFEEVAILPPTATKATDFVGTGFTANWEEVEGATGYLLNLYAYDPEAEEVFDILEEDIAVEGTSYTFKGLDPTYFFAYDVRATDGTNVSAESNLVAIVELMAPTDVKVTLNETLPGIDVTWEAPYNANAYVVSGTRNVKVAAGQMITLANGDLTAYESTGTLTEPEEDPYYFEIELPELPGWTVGCPNYVDGAVGFVEDLFYSFFGYDAYVTSDNYDLSNLKDGKVNLTLNAASGTETALQVYLLTPNYETGYYEVLDAVVTEPLTTEFEDYDVTLTGCNEECCIYIVADPQTYTETEIDEETGEEVEEEYNVDGLNAFFRSIKFWGVTAEEGYVGMPLTSEVAFDETSCQIASEYGEGDIFKVTVKPYLINDEGSPIATGHESEPATVTATVGVENVAAAANDGVARYFNLQGMPVERPEAGVCIRVVNGKATKVAIR